MVDEITRPDLEKAKFDRLYDLLRRAAVNGTTREVAEYIAVDWFPVIEIDAKGHVSFRHAARSSSSDRKERNDA